MLNLRLGLVSDMNSDMNIFVELSHMGHENIDNYDASQNWTGEEFEKMVVTITYFCFRASNIEINHGKVSLFV